MARAVSRTSRRITVPSSLFAEAAACVRGGAHGLGNVDLLADQDRVAVRGSARALVTLRIRGGGFLVALPGAVGDVADGADGDESGEGHGDLCCLRWEGATGCRRGGDPGVTAAGAVVVLVSDFSVLAGGGAGVGDGAGRVGDDRGCSGSDEVRDVVGGRSRL